MGKANVRIAHRPRLFAGKGVSVDEERSVCGAYGKGSIDFIIEFDGFDIVVLEVS